MRVRISKELRKPVDALAKEHNLTVSHIVNRAVRQYLAQIEYVKQTRSN